MMNFVFQPDEIRFRFWQVKIFPVTLSRYINFLEKYGVAETFDSFEMFMLEICKKKDEASV